GIVADEIESGEKLDPRQRARDCRSRGWRGALPRPLRDVISSSSLACRGRQSVTLVEDGRATWHPVPTGLSFRRGGADAAQEDPMRASTIGIALALAFGLTSTLAHAQSWRPPADNQRCPSKWGAGDERGSGNHMKPETVLRAVRFIRTGKVIELGRVLTDSMPLSAGRRFELLTKRSRMDPGSNHRGSN